MDWGMKNRLSRIINPKTGKTVMLAVDHGYFLGPTTGLENPSKTIEPLLPYADSLMLTRGVLRNSVDASADVPIVLRVSGANSIVGEDLSNEAITVSMKDAIRLNAAAVALSIYVGSKYEHQTLKNLADLVDQAEDYGIPVLAVTAVGKEMARDARYLSLACRIAAGLGAHFV
ncbi:MAG: 3-hydroxy-5-phosphonooxypentane-2,4-dione thiolase, partial [Candidatus Omnitrophica bacterium]|nr:3-hydroxy-5-phosphonooxypentane-2,4-dione thiolase [Candidatus Omnitrophota bacterium]